MSDLVAEFLEHLAKERDVSPHTLKAYARDLLAERGQADFAAWMEANGVESAEVAAR